MARVVRGTLIVLIAGALIAGFSDLGESARYASRAAALFLSFAFWTVARRSTNQDPWDPRGKGLYDDDSSS